MHMTVTAEMSRREVYESAKHGNKICAALREREMPAETFRFPQALLMLAIGNRRSGIVGNMEIAIRSAVEWSTNYRLTDADAVIFIRKIVRQHKAEIIAIKNGD